MAPADRPGLLERDAKLRSLEQAIGAAASGVGRVVLVSGPSGIGKTSLLETAAASAARSGCRVLIARGGVLESAIGYGVVRQLLEQTVARVPRVRRRRLLRGSAVHAARALAITPHDGEPWREAPPVDESVSVHGLYWLAANLAAEQPLALIVDDAQWADQSSLRWLLYLARRIDVLAVTLLVGMRAGETDVSYDVLDLLAAEPGAEILRPAPLGTDGCCRLLGRLYGSASALSGEAKDELRRLGVRPPASSVSGPEVLTPSERRVALMAAEGMTNPRIAQALFLTRATIESHLHRSYRKLGITSRSQLTSALGDID